MKKNNTRQLVYIAMLSALSLIFYMLERFMVIPGTFLKMDLSDFPVIIGSYVFGFVPGVFIALTKNILHVLFLSSDGSIVGEMANFAFGLFLSIGFSKIETNDSLRKQIVIGIFSIVLASFLMHWFNYFVAFPLYGVVANKNKMLLTIFLPFNLFKGTVLLALFVLFKPYFDRIKR